MYVGLLPSLHFISTFPPSADAGFIVPDKFVVGYAIDYNEYFRDLKVSQFYLLIFLAICLLPAIFVHLVVA